MGDDEPVEKQDQLEVGGDEVAQELMKLQTAAAAAQHERKVHGKEEVVVLTETVSLAVRAQQD